ncbi:ThiF family adenylyltransferase, partial [Staphylococcus aureus]
DVAAAHGIAVVFGSLSRFEGQVAVFRAGAGPCYRCLYPEPPRAAIPNCAEAGILGAVAGTIGSLQALEATKLVLEREALPT